ncbi:MAG: S8 family peptidase [Bacteroidales bacterium]|nr:S8 family peptidase [Bacteroidales bacterium]
MKKVIILAMMLLLGGLVLANNDGKIKINIILKEQSNVTELMRTASAFPTKAAQRAFVVSTLKRQAEESQFDLMQLLNELEDNGLAEDIRPLWLVNSVSCLVDASVIQEIEKCNGVLTVYECERLPMMDDNQAVSVAYDDRREIAQNLLQVNVPEVWAQGYTGQGVVVAVIDTGVSLTHADLQGCFWEGGIDYPNHGYDFANHDNDPTDQNGHGTHVAGTICGTGASGTHTGVAPDATIMVLKVFNTEDQTDETILVEAMQFAVEHGADLMNMSLGWPDPSAAVKRLYRQACENTLAAGVVAAVCAGNVRHMQFMIPIPRNIYSPGDCPPPSLHEDQLVNPGGESCVISVGAVDYNDAITYFSSAGPSTWTDVEQYNDYPYNPESPTEIGLIRPDLCAPGLQIKSLDFQTTDGYKLMDGTSMATPCVAGTIALMLSKNPELTPAQIDEILESTAVKLTEHKSNDFGSGRIDALAAVNAVDPDAIGESGATSVLVYPNPTQEAFTVACEGLKQVSVYSADGRLVRQTTTNTPCRVEGLSKGVYLVSIVTDTGTVTKKLVVI